MKCLQPSALGQCCKVSGSEWDHFTLLWFKSAQQKVKSTWLNLQLLKHFTGFSSAHFNFASWLRWSSGHTNEQCSLYHLLNMSQDFRAELVSSVGAGISLIFHVVPNPSSKKGIQGHHCLPRKPTFARNSAVAPPGCMFACDILHFLAFGSCPHPSLVFVVICYICRFVFVCILTSNRNRKISLWE